MCHVPLPFHPSSFGCFDNIQRLLQNKKPTAVQLSPASHYLPSLSGNFLRPPITSPLFQATSSSFKVCKSVHHRTIQIDHQPDATVFQFIILTFIYSSTCFGRSPAHLQELNDCSGSVWFYLRIVVIAVLCSWSGLLWGIGVFQRECIDLWSCNVPCTPTRCNNFPIYYPDVYLQLNMFRTFSRPSSGGQWLQ